MNVAVLANERHSQNPSIGTSYRPQHELASAVGPSQLQLHTRHVVAHTVDEETQRELGGAVDPVGGGGAFTFLEAQT